MKRTRTEKDDRDRDRDLASDMYICIGTERDVHTC